MPWGIPYGYRFIAREDDWDRIKENFRVGHPEHWDKVGRGEVRFGLPVLVILCASSSRRLAGTAKVIDPPSYATEVQKSMGWVEYTSVFDEDAYTLPPRRTTAEDRSAWDNRRLPLTLGLESIKDGQPAAPCQGQSKTCESISVADSQRIRWLFPGIPWGPEPGP